MHTALTFPTTSVTRRELPQEREARELRESLALEVNRALVQKRYEVRSYQGHAIRDDVSNAVYQAGVGMRELDELFADAAQAVAAGETFGVIGQRFAAYLSAARAHYVDGTADGIEDAERRQRVTYEARQ